MTTKHVATFNGQTFTRTSANRTYTHVVLGRPSIEQARKELAADEAHAAEHGYDEWIERRRASFKKQVEDGRFDKFSYLGWSGSRDLAEKVASAARSRGGYAEIEIVEAEIVQPKAKAPKPEAAETTEPQAPAAYFARQGWFARIEGKHRSSCTQRGALGREWREGYDARVAFEESQKASAPKPAALVAPAPKVSAKVAKAKALPASAIATREAWLNAFTDAARPHFEEAGCPIPVKVRSSVGFTSKGIRSNRIGECWPIEASADGTFEIFIHPTLLDNAARAADVLTHELVHTAVGLEVKHGPQFKGAATRLGLVGKATATEAGPRWHVWADPILKKLGPIPGSQLASRNPTVKTQTTRMLKLTCDCCGWSARTARSHLEGHDLLHCPIPGCDGELLRVG